MLEQLHAPKTGSKDVKYVLMRINKEGYPDLTSKLSKTLSTGFGNEDINIKDVNIMADEFAFKA